VLGCAMGCMGCCAGSSQAATLVCVVPPPALEALAPERARGCLRRCCPCCSGRAGGARALRGGVARALASDRVRVPLIPLACTSPAAQQRRAGGVRRGAAHGLEDAAAAAAAGRRLARDVTPRQLTSHAATAVATDCGWAAGCDGAPSATRGVPSADTPWAPAGVEAPAGVAASARPGSGTRSSAGEGDMASSGAARGGLGGASRGGSWARPLKKAPQRRRRVPSVVRPRTCPAPTARARPRSRRCRSARRAARSRRSRSCGGWRARWPGSARGRPAASTTARPRWLRCWRRGRRRCPRFLAASAAAQRPSW